MQTRIRRKPGICRFTEMERDFISHLVRAALSSGLVHAGVWKLFFSILFLSHSEQSLKLLWNYTEKLYMISTK